MACIKCNHLLIAPKWSAYATKHEVRHFWSCDNCGHEIEIAVDLRIGAGQDSGTGRRVNTREARSPCCISIVGVSAEG
jgi:RNase P subunit RPR2